MKKPKVVDTCCEIVDLAAGKYKWCACGESKNQPYCDGAHSGSEFAPVEFEMKEPGRVKLCLCKQTKKGPFCDGSHGSL
jgi:CDGSH-type Zn-finger protein